MKTIGLILGLCLSSISTSASVDKKLEEDSTNLYQKWKLENIRSLTQGLHGIDHDLEILDLRTKGKLMNAKGKKGVNYKLQNNVIVFVDKKGRSLAGTKRLDKEIELRIVTLEHDRLVLLIGSDIGGEFELTYRSMGDD